MLRTWVEIHPMASWEEIEEIIKSPAVSSHQAFKTKGILMHHR